jgi:DNA mismatch repair protein MutS
VDQPPQTLRDGGIIKKGFNAEVDEIRSMSVNAKDYIAKLQAQEKEATGISSLKVGYNKVFGYYIEVTKSNLDQVPEHYIRKQTLVGAERFITPELKEYESKVLGAEDRLKSLEYEVFMKILERARQEAPALMDTAEAIAKADFLLSLTVVAKRHNYVMPEVNEDTAINIKGGRHPVLERLPLGERFIPNDSFMDGEDARLLVITGPNMAGKSTFMRQVALISLMAQMGSFVPAEEAVIGIADRIFTRIGASDFLTKGQSTFMVEMIETANILNNATDKSLIVLDEVGRGTSTFDGISIAWATAEYISRKIKARTLFATHYNELTELSQTLKGVKNYNVAVKEWGEEIIFLRKIEEGPADKSYGIQVARLAGLPEEVVSGAKDILTGLEKQHVGEPSAEGQNQLDLFGVRSEVILKELQALDLDGLAHEEAVEKLKELHRRSRMLS